MMGFHHSIRFALMLSSLLIGGRLLADDGEREVAAEINKANGLLRSGEIDAAVKAYGQVQAGAPGRADVSYNMAVAQYRKGDVAAAEELFKQSSTAENDALAAKSRYNLGNCNYASAIKQAVTDRSAAINSLSNAIENYRSALDIDPNDADSRANIELAAAMIDKLREEEKKQQQQQDKKQQDQKQQSQQNDDKQNEQNKENSKSSDNQQQKDSQQGKSKGQQNDQQKDQQQSQHKEQQQKPESSQENKSKREKSTQDQKNKSGDDKNQSPDKNESSLQQQKSQSQNSKSEQQSQAPEAKSLEQNKSTSAEDKQQPQSQQQSQSATQRKPTNKSPHEQDVAQPSEQPKDKKGSAAPKGSLTAADQKAGKTDQQGKEMVAKPEIAPDGAMTTQEAEKMLQAIRDQEMIRRLRRQAAERNQHVPVDRDW